MPSLSLIWAIIIAHSCFDNIIKHHRGIYEIQWNQIDAMKCEKFRKFGFKCNAAVHWMWRERAVVGYAIRHWLLPMFIFRALSLLIHPVVSRSHTQTHIQYLITFSFSHANTTFATLTIQPCVFYCDSHEYARCDIRIRIYNINISQNCIAL